MARHPRQSPRTPPERLRDLGASASEHFEDFVILVRSGDGFMWVQSDKTWGIGAAKRYGTILDEDDRDIRRNYQPE